jgi:nucleotide-binding universal stress UspA family protein
VEIRERITSGPDTATTITREAASEAADLLVVGTRDAVHPASQLGSVSAAVALDTPCPLLLVPPETGSE